MKRKNITKKVRFEVFLYQLADDNIAIEVCTDYAKSCRNYSDFRDFLDDQFGVVV